MYVFKPGAQVFAVGEELEPIGFVVCHNGASLQIDSLEQNDLEDMRLLLAGSSEFPSGVLARRLRAFGAIEQLDEDTEELLEASALSRQMAYLSSFTSVRDAAARLAELSDTVALIVGVGGLGCHIAEHLVRSGLRRLILVDHDRVEDSNLNRQILFDAADVGRLKVAAAGARLRAIGAQEVTECRSIDELVQRDGLLASANVAFITADNSPLDIREQLVQRLYRAQTPYLFAGYNGSAGHIRSAVFRFDQGCGNCLAFLAGPKAWLHNLNAYKRASIPPSGYAVNAMLGALAVDAWMRSRFDDEVENFELKLSLSNYAITRSSLRAVEGCPVCGEDIQGG